MHIAADVLLVCAALMTILLGGALTAPLPLGPDRAMIGLTCFFTQGPRWLCLAIVLSMCVTQGAFHWPRARAAQYVVVLVLHALLGLGSLACALAAIGKHYPGVPAGMMWVLMLVPLLVPSMQIVFAAWLLNPALRSGLDEATVRTVTHYALVAFAVIVVSVAGVGAVAYQRSLAYEAAQRATFEAQERAAQAAKAQAAEGAFRVLTPESPLTDWLRFIATSHSDAHRHAAREAMLQRPQLAAELSAAIRATDVTMARQALEFVGTLQSPPAMVADAVRAQASVVLALVQSIDPGDPDSRERLYRPVYELADGVRKAAFGLWHAGVDLRPELRAMVEACRPHGKGYLDDIAFNYDYLIQYLSEKASKAQ